MDTCRVIQRAESPHEDHDLVLVYRAEPAGHTEVLIRRHYSLTAAEALVKTFDPKWVISVTICPSFVKAAL